MYKIVKAVIESKRYELKDMLTKIDTFWVQGQLSDAEHTELIDLSRANALPENSYASMQERMDAMHKELEALKVRVKALETEDEAEVPSEETTEDYPEYVAPTGAHDAYHAGDKVTYNGEKYICIALEGVAVVWNPDVMPSYWKEETDGQSTV